MKVGRILFFFGLAVLFLNTGPLPVFASPATQVLYTETSLGGGLWQYSYTVSNVSDPLPDPGFDLYDVFFQFDDTSKLATVVSLPSGWEGIPGLGFVDVFSLNPGSPPIGTDIAPGASLSGFIFQFDYRPGNIDFDATLTDPLGGDPFMYSGQTTPDIPIPGTLLLFVSGLSGLGLFARFGKSGGFKKHKSKVGGHIC